MEDILNQYDDIFINPPSSSQNARVSSHRVTNLMEESKMESVLESKYPIIVIKESELFDKHEKNKTETQKQNKLENNKKLENIKQSFKRN